MKDSNVLEKIDKAISAGDSEAVYKLEEEAILYILESLRGDDTEGLNDQVYMLHQLQTRIYDSM